MKRQMQGISSGMYIYTHHCESGVNIHDVFVERSPFRVMFSYIGVICFLANVCHTFLPKSLCIGSFWSVPFSTIVAKCLQYKSMKKESLVIVTAFGIHIEQYFWTSLSFYLFYTYVILHIGRVHCRFVNINKIIKSVLNECVTPVTCYWSLALLLHDEDETKLKLHPPVKLLLPICKALCATATIVLPWFFNKMIHICMLINMVLWARDSFLKTSLPNDNMMSICLTTN
ncbi:hypothetical protein ZWY2020_038938 [Hordeum vulgare]|nr:hypothetical protein ZWY2020_038938 [Hordeum vulgare]